MKSIVEGYLSTLFLLRILNKQKLKSWPKIFGGDALTLYGVLDKICVLNLNCSLYILPLNFIQNSPEL